MIEAESPQIPGARRLAVVNDNVWQFVASNAQSSPVQPVADIGLGHIEFNPPRFLIEAHKKALDEVKSNQYGPPAGLPVFLEAISDAYSPFHERRIDAEHEISVHTGGTEAILSCFTAFLEPNDAVILIEPAFDLYWRHAKFLGATVRAVTLRSTTSASSKAGTPVESDQWVLDMEELERAVTPRTKMLVVNNPHNPLGKVFTVAELLAIGNFCVKHGILILSDEVYEYLHYTPTFTRIAALSPSIAAHTLTVSSVGKAFNATGWRIGFTIGPKPLIEQVKRAHIVLGYTSPSAAQAAAAIGFEQANTFGFWKSNIESMKRKIDSLCEILQELGLPYVSPSGSIFVFVDIGSVQIPQDYVFPPSLVVDKPHDWKVCWFLIQELGVATIPGSAFYSSGNPNISFNYLRLVVCKTDGTINLVKQRLKGLKPFVRHNNHWKELSPRGELEDELVE